jgi:soluble lytic murein transglycosylase-like protein
VSLIKTIGASLICFAGAVVPARAELAFLQNGNAWSIRGHRTEGDSLVLMMRAGGEIVCSPSFVVRFEPDEVPYPEPAPAAEAPVAGASIEAPAVVVPYGDIIDSVSAKHGVSAELVRAVIRVESGYQQRARSRKGAMGLMQLMPETARRFSVADPYDPRQNIEGGIRYLKTLLDRFPLRLALAAYNAGEAAIDRFSGIPPYAETRDYVARILHLVGQ